MLASVLVPALNLRALPDISGQVICILPKNALLDVYGRRDNWLEVKFQQQRGFVSSHFVNLQPAMAQQLALVNVAGLNVRAAATTRAEVLGVVSQGAQLSVLSQQDDWLEIEFNGATGFVLGALTQRFERSAAYRAEVTTGLLNLRALPSLQGAVLGQLSGGSQVDILADLGDWAELKFNSQSAYVARQFIHPLAVTADTTPPVISPQSTQVEEDSPMPIAANLSPTPTPLAPLKTLPLVGDSTQQLVAKTWNSFGGLLQSLSDAKGLDVACALAVLCVESSGKGFEQTNQNRMIIRFENHKFWSFWGKQNTELFQQHFKFDALKPWTQHQFSRAGDGSDWKNFHGNQITEWEVFEFACGLDTAAAQMSISMGAPQIMGFNFKQIGYLSVGQMFEEFSAGMEGQIQGLFDFFTAQMVEQLQALEFEAFAGLYNGGGQKAVYGGRIRASYQAFKKLVSV